MKYSRKILVNSFIILLCKTQSLYYVDYWNFISLQQLFSIVYYRKMMHFPLIPITSVASSPHTTKTLIEFLFTRDLAIPPKVLRGLQVTLTTFYDAFSAECEKKYGVNSLSRRIIWWGSGNGRVSLLIQKDFFIMYYYWVPLLS